MSSIGAEEDYEEHELQSLQLHDTKPMLPHQEDPAKAKAKAKAKARAKAAAEKKAAAAEKKAAAAAEKKAAAAAAAAAEEGDTVVKVKKAKAPAKGRKKDQKDPAIPECSNDEVFLASAPPTSSLHYTLCVNHGSSGYVFLCLG